MKFSTSKSGSDHIDAIDSYAGGSSVLLDIFTFDPFLSPLLAFQEKVFAATE